MESPGGWTLLTSSLSVVNLEDSAQAWRFLRTQQLVIESSKGPVQLADAIEREKARGRITGGSLALRISEHLLAQGLTLPQATSPDPFGEVAAEKWRAFARTGS